MEKHLIVFESCKQSNVVIMILTPPLIDPFIHRRQLVTIPVLFLLFILQLSNQLSMNTN